jgi:glucose uptake protein GlcU
MQVDENTSKIILGVIALLTVIAGGAIYSVKKSKNRRTNTTQKNITQSGNGNKVVGGDDNSTTH